MKKVYVEGLSNDARLMAGVAAVENRGAREAGILAVEGEPGYGKSRALMRLAVLKPSVHVRAKIGWTPLWAASDLAGELGISAGHRLQAVVSAVIEELMQRPKMLIVDEINHATRKLEVIGTLRDVSDISESALVVGGTKGFIGQIKRDQPTYDRIYTTITFSPATLQDVQLMCRQLSDVEIGDCLVEEIHRRTSGKLRLVMNAIARVDAVGKKMRGKVTLAMYGNRPLRNEEEQHPRGVVVPLKEAVNG